jgi:hypothetical protein
MHVLQVSVHRSEAWGAAQHNNLRLPDLVFESKSSWHRAVTWLSDIPSILSCSLPGDKFGLVIPHVLQQGTLSGFCRS